MLNSSYLIGIDIGGTHFRIGAVLENGDVLRHQIGSSHIFLDAEHPVQMLIDEARSFIAETPGQAQGICIGFPGTVTNDEATVLSCPHLPVFDGVNIRAAVEEALGVPVCAAHDVLFLLSNDLHAYNLENKDCVMAVYLGTGIGNALYIHGRLFHGKNGTSGELGHIPVPGNHAPCPCGNRGCLELMASGKRLEQIRKSDYPDAADFESLFAPENGGPVIDNYLDAIACAIATEVNILDPDCVLLGGGVLHIGNFPFERLRAMILEHTRKPYPAEGLAMVRLPEDPLRGVRGAGLYGWRKRQEAAAKSLF